MLLLKFWRVVPLKKVNETALKARVEEAFCFTDVNLLTIVSLNPYNTLQN